MGLSIERLKKRAEFLRAARGIRRTMPGLTLEICSSTEAGTGVRAGFTATRKIGGAVVRNRAKRRLRAAAAALLPALGRAGTDYVLVARQATVSRDFESLKSDLAQALQAAHVRLDKQSDGAAS